MPGTLGSRRILISGIPVGSFGLALLAGLAGPAATLFLLCGESQFLPARALIVGLVLIAFANYSLCRDVLHPACMYSFVWLMAAITYELYPAEIDPLVWPTVLILLAGTVAFTMGCMLGARPISRGRPWFTDARGRLPLSQCSADLLCRHDPVFRDRFDETRGTIRSLPGHVRGRAASSCRCPDG